MTKEVKQKRNELDTISHLDEFEVLVSNFNKNNESSNQNEEKEDNNEEK
ncbi:hypothetical protein RYX45_06410 [Alkalihalophilus pseudofirmus]|uniref:Uncharacterized protein n=1 Tax=Alkalihalophilus pseudofirmus TaxID=79885 RepID=A0AAJ2KZI2_ALKPS|nr:hypothetical protein [Alkalihalophilus pseudofirmus]MDV2884803.1 hypothetical protein [Alkalihalophilus pseudofirmus]